MSSFDSYNRRMHNKLLLADGHFAILGGRNITNEYYGLHQPYNFLDIDVMVTGPVSGRIAKAFDLFWNSQPAYAIAPDKGARAGARQQKLRAEVAQDVAAQADLIGPLPPHTSDWSALLEDLPHRMHSGRSIFLQDNPEVLNNHTYRLIDMVADIGQGSEEEAIIVTPYLIPVGDFVEDLKAAVDAGVRVRVLTASLAAGDHSAVHAHYKKYRKQLLEAGIELHEMNHQPSEAVRKLADNPPVRGDFIALHPKVAISDRDRCFIGSLNLDPRAIELNTENGLYISSEGLCGELAELVEVYLAPENAWRVSFDENGKIQWTSSEGTVRRAPARSFGQRSSDFFFRLLPLEKQL
jgi:putative cardiolipin synthase